MENATKALLIAASVLIVILLISLGVGIFTSAEEQMGNADLSEYQVRQFNDKFKKYEGTSVSGSDVNALLETVFNHNMNNDVKLQVKCTAKTKPTTWKDVTATKPTLSYAKFSTANRYSVSITKYNAGGLAEIITITDAK